MRRSLSALLAAALLVSAMPAAADDATVTDTSNPALSTTDGAVQELSSCVQQTGRGVGLCYSDMIKQWQRATKDFVNAQEVKRNQWRSAHGQMGRTDEYLKMLKDFSDGMHAESETFFKNLKAEQRAFFDARKQLLNAGTQLGKKQGLNVTPQNEIANKCMNAQSFLIRNMCIRLLSRPSLIKAMGTGAVELIRDATATGSAVPQ
jgi:hypothetical protein